MEAHHGAVIAVKWSKLCCGQIVLWAYFLCTYVLHMSYHSLAGPPSTIGKGQYLATTHLPVSTRLRGTREGVSLVPLERECVPHLVP